MADVALPSQPKPVAGAGVDASLPTNNLAIAPPAVRSLQQSGRLNVDTQSPVTQNGSFEFDRIIKSGEVLKRTRKTKSWKTVHLVLRPNLLSIYKDQDECKLRHQVNLSELTAVARQKDPRRKEKHVFGLFTPARNFHLEASSDKEAHEWVELIRREARFDEVEEEMSLMSPGGAHATYEGFERSIDTSIMHAAVQATAAATAAANDERAAGYSSSDAEAFSHPAQPLPRQRDRGRTSLSARRPSAVDYSGPEHGSFSDFSDGGGGGGSVAFPAARLSALSLAGTDGRPSTSSVQGPPSSLWSVGAAAISAQPAPAGARPPMGMRNPSQASGLALGSTAGSGTAAGAASDEARKPASSSSTAGVDERVIYHGWIYLLKSTSGVRQWKKVWMVLRPKALAMYKNEEEYTASLVLPFANIIDVVEIDPISKSKTACMQIIGDERNYRLCAFDEESLARWLGGFKSLLSKRKAKVAGGGSGNGNVVGGGGGGGGGGAS